MFFSRGSGGEAGHVDDGVSDAVADVAVVHDGDDRGTAAL
jgi:hypothetical protein